MAYKYHTFISDIVRETVQKRWGGIRRREPWVLLYGQVKLIALKCGENRTKYSIGDQCAVAEIARSLDTHLVSEVRKKIYIHEFLSDVLFGFWCGSIYQ